MNKVAMSCGSACVSGSVEPSYVLKALGIEDERALSTIRIGLGKFTTKEEVLAATDIIVKQVNELRNMRK